MSNIVVCNPTKETWLQRALGVNVSGAEDFVVALFANNVTFLDTFTLGNVTIASFTGYANVTVPLTSFQPPFIAANIAYQASNVVPIFNCTGGSPQTVYGWCVIGNTTGTLLFGQNFPAPRALSSGLSETLYPFQIQLGNF